MLVHPVDDESCGLLNLESFDTGTGPHGTDALKAEVGSVSAADRPASGSQAKDLDEGAAYLIGDADAS